MKIVTVVSCALVFVSMMAVPRHSEALVLSLEPFTRGELALFTSGPAATLDIRSVEGGVELRLTNLAAGTLAGGSSALDALYLNYAGAGALSFMDVPEGAELSYAPDAFRPATLGRFDIRLQFVGGDYLPTNGSATFRIVGDDDVSHFVAPGFESGAAGPFTSAAHIAAAHSGMSPWVAAMAVPEPATWALVGLGLLAYRARRRIF